MWARINLIPLLQAEEDRDQVRRYWADQAREKALVGDNMKVYHKDRYVHIPLDSWSRRPALQFWLLLDDVWC